MGQPGLTYFEPAYADELALLMHWAFGHIQADEGGSVYLRLSTRLLEQPARADESWKADALRGAYWLHAPQAGSRLAIAYVGAIAPEALTAWEVLREDLPGLGLLAITSPDLLHREWSAANSMRGRGRRRQPSHIETLLTPLASDAGIVTLIDGSPAALSWLGGVRGHRVSPLGIDRFGQTGDLPDLYRTYRLDPEAVFDAAAELILAR